MNQINFRVSLTMFLVKMLLMKIDKIRLISLRKKSRGEGIGFLKKKFQVQQF